MSFDRQDGESEILDLCKRFHINCLGCLHRLFGNDNERIDAVRTLLLGADRFSRPGESLFAAEANFCTDASHTMLTGPSMQSRRLRRETSNVGPPMFSSMRRRSFRGSY